jgi:hypothetical protein
MFDRARRAPLHNNQILKRTTTTTMTTATKTSNNRSGSVERIMGRKRRRERGG